MAGYGVQSFLAAARPGGPVPHEVFTAEAGGKASTLLPVPSQAPAACLHHEPRIWIVGTGRSDDPYQAVTPAQARLLRQRYRLSYVRHVPGLSVFLLVARPPQGAGGRA